MYAVLHASTVTVNAHRHPLLSHYKGGFHVYTGQLGAAHATLA